jgi:hypothetical protein
MVGKGVGGEILLGKIAKLAHNFNINVFSILFNYNL